MRKGIEHWKARGLDFSRVFHQPDMPAEVARLHCEAQDHGLARALDHQLIAAAAAGARQAASRCGSTYRIRNAQPLGRRDAVRRGRAHATATQGLPDDTIHVAFDGIAGQSFGAFLARGVTFELQGATQRLRRQGTVGRPHRRLSGSRRARRSRRTTSSSATP